MLPIQNKLSKLKQAIRFYIACLGLIRAMTVFVMGMSVLIAVDYLPVPLGFTEFTVMPRVIVFLCVIAFSVLALIRYLILPLLTPIGDESIRLLIERSQPELADRLLTIGLADSASVSTNDRQDEMLTDLKVDIEDIVAAVRFFELVTIRPIVTHTTMLGVLVLTLTYVTFVSPEIVGTGLKRNLLFSNITYPRQTQIVDIHLRVVRKNERLQEFFPAKRRDLLDLDSICLGRGDSIELTVETIYSNTDAVRDPDHVCMLSFKLDNGQRGRIELPRRRKTSDGHTVYASDQGILNSLENDGQFWVKVNDATWGPFRMLVKAPPVVAEIRQDIKFPKYLSENSIFEDGPKEFVTGSRYPQGSDVTLQIQFDRPNLSSFQIWNAKSGARFTDTTAKLSGNQLTLSCSLEGDLELELAVVDDDELLSEQPIRLNLTTIKDRKPSVNVTPVGIGSVVTSNAIIPIQIDGDDEFGIARGSIRLNIAKINLKDEIKFDWNTTNQKIVEIDLRQLQQTRDWNLPEDMADNGLSLEVSTSLSDHNPENSPSIGQTYEFEIVDEKRLVQVIERQEANLRKRLEAIYEEFKQSRSLAVATISLIEAFQTNDPQSQESLYKSSPVFIQRMRLQSQKSSREILAIANATKELVQQLANNRLRVQSKQLNLSTTIETPLREFAKIKLDEFQADLVQWNKEIRETAPANLFNEKTKFLKQAQIMLSQHDQLSQSLFSIIQSMVKFESQSQLLDSIRSLIDDHKKLMDETSNELERKLFEGILDK